MRNIVYHAIILGMVSSLTTAEYSGSASSSGGYGKSGLSSSYNAGYVGEYAGQLSVGKALSEIHGYGKSQIAPEHGNQYENGGDEPHYNDAYGQQQNDGGHEFSSSHYDGYRENLDLSKFPIDVEAHHYTGGGSSDVGLGEEDHQQEQHQYGGQQDYQRDDEGDQTAKQPYSSYTGSEKQYKGYQDHVSMQIVPYSGYEEAEEHGEQPSKYSGYDSSQHSYNEEYEEPKAPSPTYESSKASSSPSYSPSYEAAKAPGPSYSPSYEVSKAPTKSYSSSYEDSDAPSSSYSSSYEAPKPPSTSYSSSYEAQKAPNPTYNSLSTYDSGKSPSSTPGYDYSIGNSGSYESHDKTYQHLSAPAQEKQSNVLIHKIKGSSLINFHSPMTKKIMTIDHGKGSFSYSSLYT